MDVIGVGSITVDDAISRFSSRGMTTWEVNKDFLVEINTKSIKNAVLIDFHCFISISYQLVMVE